MTIQEILFSLLILVVTTAIVFLIGVIKERVGVEKMKKLTGAYDKFIAESHVKNSLAFTAVKYAQQLLPREEAMNKYSEAATFLSNQLKSKGINTSDLEIKALVESAVKEAKKVFGDEWKKTIK